MPIKHKNTQTEAIHRICEPLVGIEGEMQLNMNKIWCLLADIDVFGLRRQQMELLTLCAVRGLLTTRTRLRKVLMQPPDNVGE